jgi:TRAP-type C4-dicarboxylate transport system permease small subunit
MNEAAPPLATYRAPALPAAVVAVSEAIARVERWALIGLMSLVTGLILVNVVSRYIGRPIYWIDESAIYAVVWLCFIGASVMARRRLDFAVTLLTERLSAAAAKAVRVFATASLALFGIALGVMCWLWLDPIGIAAAGFDAREYAGQTFNFLYTERTQTLNWPSWVVYLILPIFAASLTIHGFANLMEDLGLVARQDAGPDAPQLADGIN